MEIRNILSKKDIKLLVDEAHGSHLIFHPDLPPSASQCSADIWVQSAHKTLPAFTQSSYLHIGNGRGNTDSNILTRYHRCINNAKHQPILSLNGFVGLGTERIWRENGRDVWTSSLNI